MARAEVAKNRGDEGGQLGAAFLSARSFQKGSQGGCFFFWFSCPRGGGPGRAGRRRHLKHQGGVPYRLPPATVDETTARRRRRRKGEDGAAERIPGITPMALPAHRCDSKNQTSSNNLIQFASINNLKIYGVVLWCDRGLLCDLVAP